METKHSGFGIASFILAIFTGICIFLILCVAGVLGTLNPRFFEDEHSPILALIGLLTMGFIGIDIIAFALGVVGCCLPNRKKVFAILGIIFSVLVPVGTIILAIIGNSMD